MPHRALNKCHIVAIGQLKSDWPQPKVKTWVEEAGGKISFQPNVTADTTHLVILEKTWKEQGDFLRQVLAAKEEDDRDIHIVNYEWLQDSLVSRSKKRESPYSFEKMQKNLDDAARTADKKQAKIQKALEPRSGSGLMAQVFTESTDPFVTSITKAREQRAAEEAARFREETKAEQKLVSQKLREHKNITKLAAVFRRGVSKSRNELLSENHHVYMDQTGFHYDVVITKISFKNNQNQRHNLTIYEHHDQPHTYAFNCQYSGTNIEAQNNIIATLGSNWPTAFRAFKKVFKEKTNGEWKDRVKDACARYDREKRLDAGPEAVDFDKAYFVYHPPKYGPRGGDLMEPPLDVSPSAKPPMTGDVPIAEERGAGEVSADGMASSGADGDGAASSPREREHEHSSKQPVLGGPTNGIASDDAFQQLIADSQNMSAGDINFLGDTAFEEPFQFGETTFDQAMTNGVETGHSFIDETQTQPSSQLLDTQDLGYTLNTQDFGNVQPSFRMPVTQDVGHTQVAQQAHADLIEFVNGDHAHYDQRSASNRELSSAYAAVSIGDEPPEPGTSVLGKRKSSADNAAIEEGASPKKVARG